MAKRFEVGKTYEPYQNEYEPLTVTRRTDKTIWVKNDSAAWAMRIRTNADGDEYAIDSCVPKRWRDAFTYFA